MNRITAAARLHLVHPLIILGIPWSIVGVSFAINLALWGVADLGAVDTAFSGGLASLYVAMAIIYVQAITRLLPLAMGLSLSRRSFYLGSAVMAAIQSLAYAVIIVGLAAIEGATDGWGLGLQFWAPLELAGLNPAFAVLIYAGPLLGSAFVGMAIGVVQKRWGTGGLWALILGTLLLAGGLAILATGLDAWGGIGDWVTDRSLLTMAVGLPILLAVTLAGLTWAALRRVVP
jgi:hypothetical protein